MTPELGIPLVAPASVAEVTADSDQVFTATETELEAFQIVRAILRPVVKPGRVFIRAAASYCAILFDDNNRKPVCRLRFNNESRLVVGFFNENKEEERIPITSLDQLFDFGGRLQVCVEAYLKSTPVKESAGDIAAV